jgi:hypothetical protein
MSYNPEYLGNHLEYFGYEGYPDLAEDPEYAAEAFGSVKPVDFTADIYPDEYIPARPSETSHLEEFVTWNINRQK